MKKWFVTLFIIAVFIFLTALFLTPDFTYHCTDKLIACIEEANGFGFFARLWAHLKCVYHNVVCVLGGLFV